VRVQEFLQEWRHYAEDPPPIINASLTLLAWEGSECDVAKFHPFSPRRPLAMRDARIDLNNLCAREVPTMGRRPPKIGRFSLSEKTGLVNQVDDSAHVVGGSLRDH